MRRGRLGWVCLAGTIVTGVMATSACSADTGSGGNAGGGGGASASGGSIGIGASSGTGAASGSGGLSLDSGTGGGLGDGDVCDEIGATATNQLQPADIVFALDNSGSMDEEAVFVQQNMNVFSSQIVNAKIDAHVVIISAPQGQSNGVCIGTPLGSGSCPNDDNPPNFLHVDQSVASTNALQLIVQLFPQYQSMLRPGASKHFVVVSDDNSKMTAKEFDTAIKPLLASVDPFFSYYQFHAIFGYTFPNPLTCFSNPNADPCCGPLGVPYTAEVGTVYNDLVIATGGVKGNLCLQDFQPVFKAVATAVQQNSKIACEWQIPPPPSGQSFDPNKVNVEFTLPGNPPQGLGAVANASECAQYQGGWYYDDPTNPTKIYVCQETCNVLQGTTGAALKILFGCATKPAVPK